MGIDGGLPRAKEGGGWRFLTLTAGLEPLPPPGVDVLGLTKGPELNHPLLENTQTLPVGGCGAGGG